MNLEGRGPGARATRAWALAATLLCGCGPGAEDTDTGTSGDVSAGDDAGDDGNDTTTSGDAPPLPPPPVPGLDPDAPPSGNFDLSQWNISIPVDRDGDDRADTISETDLQGYEAPSFFFTADDGGMVFRCPVAGARTSKNTRFARVELRQMLRGGDTSIPTRGVTRNNWVFGTAPRAEREAAGGVDGTLTATLAVNRVTTTGDRSQVGRVIIGQVHAKEDEPARLYYRKLPQHTRGSIYVAHEPSGKDDIYVELIGSRSPSAPDPADGVALGEAFSYEIDVKGNTLRVTIRRPGRAPVSASIDMSDSGYAVAGEFMYFKAGAYNQNDSGDDDDYVQATFYALDHAHEAPSALREADAAR